jgi:predicted exporter
MAAWLAAIALCGAWLASRFSVNADLTVFLPPSSTPTQRLLIGQLRDGATSRLMLVALSGGSVAERARASRALLSRLQSSEHFAFAANGDAGAMKRDQALLLSHRYLLSPAVSPERFSPKGLEAALQTSLALLASPAAPVVRPTIPLDPTGELRELLQLLAPQDGPHLRHGVWFSKDESRALLIAQTRAPGFDVEAQALAAQAVEAALAAEAIPDLRLELAGPGVFGAQMRETIRTEARQLSLAASLLVLLILAAFYRSARALAACALPVATGLLVGVAAVSAGFGTVHGLTLAFGATLIGEAVDYPSYLLAQAAPGESLQATVARIGPTLVLASLTTALGGLALVFSSFEGLAQLGVLTAVGVLAAAATTLWVLPHFLTPASLERRSLHAWPRLAVPRGGRWLVLAAAAAALVAVAAYKDRLWDDDLANLAPIPEAAKALDRELREQLRAPDVRYLAVARGADREAALQASESLAAWLNGATASGAIRAFDVPSTYLPSRRTQDARRRALPDPDTLAVHLKTVLARSPFQDDAFAPFIESVARARQDPLLEAEALEGSMLGVRLSSLLVHNADGWAALAPLAGVAAPAELAVQARRAGFELLDLKEEANRMVNRYREESVRLVALGLLAIAALLALSLRSIARAMRVLAPVLAAAAADVAALLLLGRSLSVFNVPAVLLVIGIGLNYALFFEREQRDREERARTGLSVAVCAATTLSVFGCLALSDTPVLKSIGETVFLGCLLALAFAVLGASRRRGPA